jgi:hypothetical protein
MTAIRNKVAPSRALYIKLGSSGGWEVESLCDGIMRFGYKETPFDAAAAGDWETVRAFWTECRGSAKTASQDLTQIQHFFEADENTLWMTFHGGYLYWCFAKPGVTKHSDGEGHMRETVDGWHKTDINGTALTTDTLSGNLLKVQGFRGTICQVHAFDDLVKKLNGELLPEVKDALEAENQMVEHIVPLMRLLTWQDFELLVELIFSQSGWRRVGELGKTQKTVDLELLLPTTGERAFVQVKSSTSKQELDDYVARHEASDAYDKMFFVWHTGDIRTPDTDDVILLSPKRLARLVFDSGLTSWLRKKVS